MFRMLSLLDLCVFRIVILAFILYLFIYICNVAFLCDCSGVRVYEVNFKLGCAVQGGKWCILIRFSALVFFQSFIFSIGRDVWR